jgi:hypothetical protein
MRTSFLISSVLLVSIGCGSSHHESTAAPPPPAGGSGMAMGSGAGDDAGKCPMLPAGTQIAVADTDGGVTVTFTTTGDVAALRARVRDMAAMHEHKMAGGSHDMGSGEEHMMMPPSHAVTADVDGGERVTLTPADPSQLDALRTAVQHHAEMMKNGDCPMMHHMGGEPAPAGSADDHAAHH